MRRRNALLVAVLFASAGFLGQAARAQAPAGTAQTETPTAAHPAVSTPGLGFSMESEMLTYAAMDRNSQAIACDVALYVYGEEQRTGVIFTPAPENTATSALLPVGELCGFAQSYAQAKEQPANSVNKDGIVILQANSGIQTGLQLWRTYMAEMESLRQAAAEQGCKADSAGQPAQAADLHAAFPLARARLASFMLADPSAAQDTTKSAQKPIVVGGPEGAVDLAQQVVAANETSEEVRGTVESQTFVNTIAGELRVLGLQVLIPETSMPHAMSSHTNYAILDEAQKLREVRDCVSKTTSGSGQSASAAAFLLSDIDAFLFDVFGWSGSTYPVTGAKISFAPTKSNMQSLLSADLLAQELRIGIVTASGEKQWRHILWVRALESGGSVIKRERFWGTKIGYSGGSIVTYALVTMDGPLECSGSFYDYGGPLSAKDFQKKGTPTLAAKIPVSAGCRALVERQTYSGAHH